MNINAVSYESSKVGVMDEIRSGQAKGIEFRKEKEIRAKCM